MTTVLVLAGVTVIGLMFAILKTANLPPPAALISVLSLLTLFAMVAGLNSDRDQAWSLAAVGMGALAGSTTSLLQGHRDKDKDS